MCPKGLYILISDMCGFINSECLPQPIPSHLPWPLIYPTACFVTAVGSLKCLQCAVWLYEIIIKYVLLKKTLPFYFTTTVVGAKLSKSCF